MSQIQRSQLKFVRPQTCTPPRWSCLPCPGDKVWFGASHEQELPVFYPSREVAFCLLAMSATSPGSTRFYPHLTHVSLYSAGTKQLLREQDDTHQRMSKSTLKKAHLARQQGTISTILWDVFPVPIKKGIRDRAMEEVEKSKQDARRAQSKARKEAAMQERKTRREKEERERAEKRQESRERAMQNKKIKAERKAQEKRVQDYYGIRGYDPGAGMLHSNRERVAHRTTDAQLQTSQKIDKMLSLRPKSSQTWGVEYGKPKEDRGKGRASQCGGGDIRLDGDLEE
ncbi:hypothetical protein CLAIMM_08029 [Cladophialophora immunda]|nr:hypothetical protein CLAIMM_08029 [Cladophialophora immunda]